MRGKYIVVSREGENKATIQCLRGRFDGDLANFDGTCKEITDAAEVIQGDLIKRGVPTIEAARYAHDMAGLGVGAINYCPVTDTWYRILEADFTSNRYLVVPGLRVEDYDRRVGTVEPGQFMDDGIMSPGGEYFEGWYEVTPDGETRGKKFNGERLRSL